MSLDVFRGLTIAGMILVNNPGSWDHIYWPLEHAPWDGWTPTDWVFPFFLFMVGVAMTFSFDKRLAKGASPVHLLGHVFCRAWVLFLLGLILTGFPNLRLITPYILGIVGLEMAFAEPKADASGKGRNPYMIPGWICVAVGVAWFVIDFHYFNGPSRRGSFADIFPLHVEGGRPIRIPGVLQRIALCYAAAALIMVGTTWRGRIAWSLGLIVVYWLVMKYVQAPAGYIIGAGIEGAKADAPAGAPFAGALNDWLDVKLLGAHLYSARPDPEGLLSTIPAIATTVLGTLAGTFIQRRDLSMDRKALLLGLVGLVFMVAGQAMGLAFPINKKIWTSSYVVAMAGWASFFLALCYWLIDARGWKTWGLPFLVLGTNAILAFFASGLVARILGMIKWGQGESARTLRGVLYKPLTMAFTDPKNASLAWAVCFVAFFVVLLTPLYRKRIFLKV